MPADAVAAVLGKRAPKTHRGRKILKDREPKIIEPSKTALILAGNKTSHEVHLLLKDLFLLRSPLAVLFSRKHDEHPFEDPARVEQLCNNFDHGLFAFGSSSKKRPFRLILGRLFDGHLLDMQEYSVDEFRATSSFHCQKLEAIAGSKPLVVFQGAGFEANPRLKHARSLLLDFFGGPKPDHVLLEGLEQVVVCSTYDTAGEPPSASGGDQNAREGALTVEVRRFRIQLSKSGSNLPRVELEEIGPRFRLTLDREKEADRERWKQAIKVPKAAKPKKEKNIANDTTGKKRGRIHLGRQDFNQIHTVHHSKAQRKKLQAVEGPATKKRKKRGNPQDL